ncbi:MAG: hypothetical protein M1546_20135 [Chloroflexi bacterium]|nr:hypothetical protein [Chloroflexota bacterium]
MEERSYLKEGEELTVPPTESDRHLVGFVYQGKVSPKGGYPTDNCKELYFEVDGEKRNILIIRGQTKIECRSSSAQIDWFECDDCDYAAGLKGSPLHLNQHIQLGQITCIWLFELTQDKPEEFVIQSEAAGLVIKGSIQVQTGEYYSQGERFALNSLGTDLWLKHVGKGNASVFLVENMENPLAEMRRLR